MWSTASPTSDPETGSRTRADGARVTIKLPQDRVFEDLEPRLFDVDRDGDFEVIVIESSAYEGARQATDQYFAEQGSPPFLNRIDTAARIAVKPG